MTAKEVVQNDLDYIVRQLDSDFKKMAGKHLLITGGAGFLGYYLVQSVLHWNRLNPKATPAQVTVCDNYMRGIPAWLTALSTEPALRTLQHDITQPVPDTLGEVDFVIHAASIASPTYYRMHPIETMDANVNGLRILLELCRKQLERKKPVSGFLFFSSSEIYGDPPADQIPTAETYRGCVSSTGPRACYDESKRYGETLCVNFAGQFGLPVRIARPFNNYGPGLKITDRRVLPDLARELFAGKDLILLSDGSPTRTFCYVADAVIGYYRVLFRGRAGEAYNIGTETPEISMRGVAELLAKHGKERFGYSGKVVCQQSKESDYLTDNPLRRCPSIAKARSHVGYAPSITLEDGLSRMLLWYHENRDGIDA
jgi:nucleoside-diphosphate-sugar epimerase